MRDDAQAQHSAYNKNGKGVMSAPLMTPARANLAPYRA